jgi:alpha-tubulin suppressor-like RCC1 family protein
VQLLPKKVEALAGRRVVAVSAGLGHSLAITADGALWSWGSGERGRLGHGDQQRRLLPKKVEALAGQRVVAVAAGANHSLALTADNAVWSWGFGSDSRLGHGDVQNQLLPKEVEALAGRRVVAVSAMGHHSIALAADGVWSFGAGRGGRLGHGDELNQVPAAAEEDRGVGALASRRVIPSFILCTASNVVSLKTRRDLRPETPVSALTRRRGSRAAKPAETARQPSV